MRTFVTLLLQGVFTVIAMVAQAEDETRFVPRNYTGSTYKDNAYKPKSYTPAQALRNTEYRESPGKRSFWNIFKKKSIAEPRMLQSVKNSDDKLFTHPDQTPLPVRRPEEEMVSDSSFKSSVDEPVDQTFVPDNRPRARDPLLAPRQGIKAPVK